MIDANEIIKPFAEEETNEKQTTKKSTKTTPFAFIEAVSFSKVDIIKENPEIEKDYNSYMTNRGFSYFADSVLFANEMNLNPSIPPIAQYYYYMASLRKRKRFSKWHKIEKNEDLDLVCEIYNVRKEVGKQYLKVLSSDDLVALRKSRETGEK